MRHPTICAFSLDKAIPIVGCKHRSEFDDLNGRVVVTVALLRKEDIAARFQFYGDRNEREERRQ